MRVRVKLFAAAKEIAGSDALVVELANEATIADLRQAIVAAAPNLARIVSHSVWAVDAEYAADNKQIDDQSDIALIPPVSGG